LEEDADVDPRNLTVKNGYFDLACVQGKKSMNVRWECLKEFLA